MSEEQKEAVAKAIVDLLKAGKKLPSTYAYANANNVDHLVVVGVVKSLDSKEVAKITQNEFTETALTAAGQDAVKLGSPEARIWEKLGTQKVAQNDCGALIGVDAEVGKSSVTNGLRLGYFAMEKGATPLVARKAASIKDETKELIEGILAGKITDKKQVDPIKKRGFVDIKVVKEYSVEAGAKMADFGKVLQTDLTEAMLTSGEWKSAAFKPYNFNALGAPISSGALHPLMKIRQEFRQIFLEMGFEEMPTNRFVESSFWNFDALFQPQFHPTRDAHDTFFVKEPAECLTVPEDYLEQVKQVHQVGGYGSVGYRYTWHKSEATKNILRTHTTAISARMLHQLAVEYKKTGLFTPKKYFSIDRVFRNEATDATHLAEFHQVEGLVADVGLTLQDLIGSLTTYFEKQGLRDLKLKPAFNPYTEPSMEIFGYHPGLGKLVELGNSGMFRPEMLRAMGLPENVSVIAWGVSLERPAMIKYAISDIRTLIGPEVPYDFVTENPICRLDK